MGSSITLERIPHSLELKRDGGGVCFAYLDQRLLPNETRVVTTYDWRVVVEAIKSLAVRGAPAIGISGAAALCLYANHGGTREGLESVSEEIATARPTAVNLRWAVDRALASIREINWEQAGETLVDLVLDMEDEDEAANRKIGENGAELIRPGSTILTHCNAGSLATYYYGTALGIVYSAARMGKVERVYADETRPVGQGARLTVWELSRAGIPTTLICDNMAASLMASRSVDAVIVGADRIARNGDVANKIGTYSLAIVAHEHGVPFYVAAPLSTIDPGIATGAEICIEQRDPSEVLPRGIEGVDVWNPAFDVTPARYITRIVTETGVYEPHHLPLDV